MNHKYIILLLNNGYDFQKILENYDDLKKDALILEIFGVAKSIKSYNLKDYVNQNDINRMLYYSAFNGDFEVVKYLVEHGADIHAYDDEALRWSAASGHLKVVKYLVEHGANIHACNDQALKLSFKNGHTEVAEYLREQ